MKYDVAVLGGGPGGYVAAIKASQLGGKVLLIEKENLGGVCLNKGCIPTKTLLKCSGTYKSIKESSNFGINVEGVSIDFKKMMVRKQNVVKTLVNGIRGLLKANGVEVIHGEGHITKLGTLEVNDTVYEAQNIIVATGSKPFIPRIKGVDSKNVMDSDEVLSMESIPSSITIIGGGVIGIEFAVLLSELGCRVTVIEMMKDIIFMADEDVIKELEKILESNKVDIIKSAKVIEIEEKAVIYEKDSKTFNIEGEKVLVAVGRIPNIDEEELDRLGIKHENGRIITDEKMQTNIKRIFAIGDVNGKYMLAHVASEEGIVAVENIFGLSSKMSYSTIPQCIYSHPEIAWVGISEREAKEKGIEVNMGKFPLSANGKSLAEGDTTGFIKIIVDKKYNEVLGVHMVCSHATDMISEGVLAMGLEATAEDIARLMHPHPTVSEALMEAANAVVGKAIHMV